MNPIERERARMARIVWKIMGAALCLVAISAIGRALGN
jgi:hypothetical protein